MSNRLKVSLACRSDIGDRDEQQDYIGCVTENGELLAVVCDGMGGLKMGSAASVCAAECLIDLFRAKKENEDIPSFFLESIDVLDEKVSSLTDENGERSGAGTTIASVCISDGLLYWMSVGDSRICILRGNDFEIATRDHNYRLLLNKMLDDGILTNEKFLEENANGDALISFIGKSGIDVMDISQGFELGHGDYILLMSDGLYKNLDNETIKQTVLCARTVEEAADNLIGLSKLRSNGQSDNVSFILIKTEAV